MTHEVRVALCQIEVIAGDREGNFSRISDALGLAKAEGATLAVFPESAILGWIYPGAHDQAHPIPGEDSDRLCAMAKAAEIAIIIGLDEKESDLLYGAAIAIDATGSLLAVHRKANVLPDLMNPPYSQGKAHAVTLADFSFGRVAMLICADTFVAETVDAVLTMKPDVLVVPYGWVAPEETWPKHGEQLRELVGGLAQKLGCPVVGVDAVGVVAEGPWQGRKYCGASVAASSSGRFLTGPRFTETFVQTVLIAPGR